MKNYKAICVFVLMVASLFLTACQKPEKAIPVILLGHAPHDHHSPLYIAAMNPEYFNEHGGIYLKEIHFTKEYQPLVKGSAVARILIDSSTGGKELADKIKKSSRK